MSLLEYVPGRRWLVASDSALVQIEGESAAALRWWPQVRDRVSAQHLVTLLHAEGVLSSGTAFAMVVAEPDGVRVIAKGDTTVVVETAAGERVGVSGDGLLTWSEVTVAQAATVWVNCRTLPAEGDLLPMPTGVVRADSVRWALGAGAARSAAGDPPDLVGDDAVTVIGVVPGAGDVGTSSASLTEQIPPHALEDTISHPSGDWESEGGTPAAGNSAAGDGSDVSTVDVSTAGDSTTEDRADGEFAATRTVPPEDFGARDCAEAADGVAETPSPAPDPDPGSDLADVAVAVDGRQRVAEAGSASMAARPPGSVADHQSGSPPNPFPRMTLRPFVPPSAPNFITTSTPPPFPPPFSPPPLPSSGQPPAGPIGRHPAEQHPVGPVGPRPISQVPGTVPPPPFVPASTTLPPISAVPGAARHASSQAEGPDSSVASEPANGDAREQSAQRPVDDSQAAGQHARPGDHDGHTVLSESLPIDYRPPSMPPAPGPGQVYASLCPDGHPNAPHAGECRICGAPVRVTEPVLVDRPVLAVLRMSTGAVIELDRRVVVGRSPSVSRVAAADVPHLVTVPSPHSDVSRSHVEVRVEDWHIVVSDLNSTNGTEIHAPGRPVQLLRAGDEVVLEIGWQVDLGDGAGFLVDHP